MLNNIPRSNILPTTDNVQPIIAKNNQLITHKNSQIIAKTTLVFLGAALLAGLYYVKTNSDFNAKRQNAKLALDSCLASCLDTLDCVKNFNANSPFNGYSDPRFKAANKIFSECMDCPTKCYNNIISA